jgi:hypothetical protein
LASGSVPLKIVSDLLVALSVNSLDDPSMTNRAPDAVMLATVNNDFGLVPAETAQREAQSLADEEGQVVYLRHPETDQVLGKATPAKAI